MWQIVISLIVAFSLVTPVYAHPGNTDSAGCHTCRTNCPSWGLSYAEYHCHNPKSYALPTPVVIPTPPPQPPTLASKGTVNSSVSVFNWLAMSSDESSIWTSVPKGDRSVCVWRYKLQGVAGMLVTEKWQRERHEIKITPPFSGLSVLCFNDSGSNYKGWLKK